MKNTSTSFLVLVSIILSACGGVAIEGQDEQLSPSPSSSVPRLEPTATVAPSSSSSALHPPVIVPIPQDAGVCLPCATHPGCQGVDCEFVDAAPECIPCATHPGCQGVDCELVDAAACEVSVCATHFSCTEPC